MRRTPGVPVAPPGRGDHRGLLLGPAHEQHALAAVVAGQVLVHHVILALALGEMDERHVIGVDEPVNVANERLGHLGHQRRGGVDESPMADEEHASPTRVLQPRLVHVEVHPIDRLDLEPDMARQDISDTAR
jgi:hypothetical protein